MAGSRKSTDPALSDDAPDLSAPEWRAKFEKAPVRRGRPLSANPKVMTTLRLDADVLEAFRAGGRGWQSRINEELKAIVNAGARKTEPKRAESPDLKLPLRKTARARAPGQGAK